MSIALIALLLGVPSLSRDSWLLGVPSLPWDSWRTVFPAFRGTFGFQLELFRACGVAILVATLEDSIGQLPCDGSRITES